MRIKGIILQEDVTTPNVYTPNNSVSSYMRQKRTELQGEIDGFTIIVRDTGTPLSEIDPAVRKSVST